MNWPHDLDGEGGKRRKTEVRHGDHCQKVDEEADFLKYVDPKSFRTITDMHKVVGDSHR